MKKNKLLSEISYIIPLIVGGAFLVFLVCIALTNHAVIFSARDSSRFQTVTDAVCEEIRDDAAPAGVVIEYRFAVGDGVGRDTSLAFYTTHQYSETYIGGELVYGIAPDTHSSIRTVGSNWVMVPLSEEDAGKEVTVRITPVYKNFIDREVEFLLGDDLAIYTARLEKDLPQLVLSALTLFIGAVFIGVGIYSILKRKQGEELAMLGLFSVMVGLWRLTDTRFTPFVFPNRPVLIFYCSMTMLMLGIIPLIKSIGYRYNPLSRKIFDIYCIGIAAVSAVQLVLQISGIMDIRQNLFVTHIMMIVGALVILANSVYNKTRYPKKSASRAIGFLPFVCVVGVLADVIAFYVKGNSSGLVFTLGAFVVYVILAGIITLLNYSEQGRRLAEKEKELLKSRIAIMLSQIKPHFLYNSLSSIGELCMTDPARARDALADFSAYLRSNMDFIDTEECVHFTNELKHIETYLQLEKMRFGNRLNVVYDVRETNFFLPPLTVQPLVENAVKHGICAKAEGGTVTLATRREGDRIVITVTDDGVGFDGQLSEEKNERSHIGIVNVKKRLEQMIGAVLTVKSEKGKGTVVTVVIEQGKGEKGGVGDEHIGAGR